MAAHKTLKANFVATLKLPHGARLSDAVQRAQNFSKLTQIGMRQVHHGNQISFTSNHRQQHRQQQQQERRITTTMTILSSMCSSCAAFAAHRFHIQATHKTSCNTPSPLPPPAFHLLYALREGRRNTQHATRSAAAFNHDARIRTQVKD